MQAHVVRAFVNAQGSIENVVIEDPEMVVNPNEELYFSNQNYLDSRSESSGNDDYFSAPAPTAQSTDSEVDDSQSSISTQEGSYYSSFGSSMLHGDVNVPSPWLNVIYDISDAPEFPTTAVSTQQSITPKDITKNDKKEEKVENGNEEENVVKGRNIFGFLYVFICCFKKTSTNTAQTDP